MKIVWEKEFREVIGALNKDRTELRSDLDPGGDLVNNISFNYARAARLIQAIEPENIEAEVISSLSETGEVIGYLDATKRQLDSMGSALVLIHDKLESLEKMGVNLKGSIELQKLKAASQALRKLAA